MSCMKKSNSFYYLSIKFFVIRNIRPKYIKISKYIKVSKYIKLILRIFSLGFAGKPGAVWVNNLNIYF